MNNREKAHSPPPLKIDDRLSPKQRKDRHAHKVVTDSCSKAGGGDRIRDGGCKDGLLYIILNTEGRRREKGRSHQRREQ